MDKTISAIPTGTITTPRGFLAGATFAGLKTFTEDKLDLGILFSELPCKVVGLFTTNTIKSASLRFTQETLKIGKTRSLVVNSGIANTSVGPQGLKDAQEMVTLAAQHLNISAQEIAVSSTGIVGVEIPMALIRSAMGKIQFSEQGGHDLARAILTTDTHPKENAVQFLQDSTVINLGGIAKGSGMIHPNMATMLAFLTTDASVEHNFLQRALKAAVDLSFNCISIDGDTSTNDMVLLYSNGAASETEIKDGHPEARLFQEALNQLCISLAKDIARDGEGATRLMEVTVNGARNINDARLVARTVVSSNLVKCAIHGADPNWGRIVTALGRSGAEIDETHLAVYINGVCLMENGQPIHYHKDAVVASMQGEEISLGIGLHIGSATATAWGCDLSENYVTFNSAYTT